MNIISNITDMPYTKTEDYIYEYYYEDDEQNYSSAYQLVELRNLVELIVLVRVLK